MHGERSQSEVGSGGLHPRTSTTFLPLTYLQRGLFLKCDFPVQKLDSVCPVSQFAKASTKSGFYCNFHEYLPHREGICSSVVPLQSRAHSLLIVW